MLKIKWSINVYFWYFTFRFVVASSDLHTLISILIEIGNSYGQLWIFSITFAAINLYSHVY